MGWEWRLSAAFDGRRFRFKIDSLTSTSTKPVVTYRPISTQALRTEWADNLSRNRTFVAGQFDLIERQLCEFVIVHPSTGGSLSVTAEAVWIQPGVGVGLSLVDYDGSARARIEAFIGQEQGVFETAATDPAIVVQLPVPLIIEDSRDDEAIARNLYDRVRELKSHERELMARQGTLQERVALERCFQGAVWEALLGNPQLTPPEVARIAKNPGLPAALVTTIANNAAWVGKSDVQRALLTNPRLTGASLDRVLRAIPKAELGAIASHAGYRAPIRQAAKKLLGI